MMSRTRRAAAAFGTAVVLTIFSVALATADTITFVSDPSWNVFNADPTVRGAVFLGKAEQVCLNAGAPNPCPVGATVYGKAVNGWMANLSTIPGATWIWAPGVSGATAPAELAEFFFTKTFTLPDVPSGGSIAIAADDFAEVLVNGFSAGSVGSISNVVLAAQAANTLATLDIGPLLKPGDNTIVVRAQNGPASFAGCEPGPCTYAQDPAGTVFGGTLAFEPPNQPPDCSGAVAVPNVVWPPNHRFVSVAVSGVADPDGDPVTVTITHIAQDEPLGTGAAVGDGADDQGDDNQGDDEGNGATVSACPTATGVGGSTAQVLAERDGQGDGRVYHLAFVADDGRGGRCAGDVTVCVPHDQGHGGGCVDEGPRFDSTGPCGPCTLPDDCDDGNPCTVDTCTPAGCQHVPVTGAALATCPFDDGGMVPPACSAVAIPTAISARVNVALRLLVVGADRRQVKQAVKQLRKAAKLVGAARHHGFPTPCADELMSRIGAARAGAVSWFRSLPRAA